MINPRKILSAGLVMAACLALPQLAHAQGSSLFGSSGTTRGGTGGISGSLTGSGFGGSGFGSMGSSGGRGTTSGLGSTLGNTGFGNSGFGQQGTGFGGTGMNSGFGATGTSGMVGRNSGAFAGNSMANQAGGAGRTGGGATRNFNSTGSNRQNANNNNNQSNQNQRTTSAIRPRQRVAFDYTAKTPAVAATNVATRLNKINRRNPALNGVVVQMDGDEVVLTGKVRDENERRLAGNMVRQEPGVRRVRNDLEVERPTPGE